MLNVDEAFTASPVEAAAYTYQRIAKYQTESNVQSAEAPAPRRRYRRRDMTAEPS